MGLLVSIGYLSDLHLGTPYVTSQSDLKELWPRCHLCSGWSWCWKGHTAGSPWIPVENPQRKAMELYVVNGVHHRYKYGLLRLRMVNKLRVLMELPSGVIKHGWQGTPQNEGAFKLENH